MERVAVLLGVVATLTTLLAWAVTLAPEDRPRAAPATAQHDDGPGWQVVERPAGRFAVPPAASGWRLGPPREVLYYADPADPTGTPVVEVAGPAVLDEGYCAAGPGPSNRAFAGLLPVTAGRPYPVVARLARRWAAAVAAPGGDVTGVRRGRAELDDGSTGVRAHAVVALPPGPCRPARAAVDLVGTRAASGVVILVLVRDLGRGSMPESDVEQVLASLRR